MINCSDMSSCDSQRHLLGESCDGDSNEDDEGVDQGITLHAATKSQQPLPTATNPQQPLPESTLDARPPNDHSCSAASNAAANVLALIVDKFYNAIGKTPHPDTIIPKVESGWWKNHKMWKKRKAKERVKVELELQKIKEDAARLAEQNANLQRELNLAWQSHSGANDPPIPSTSPLLSEAHKDKMWPPLTVGFVP